MLGSRSTYNVQQLESSASAHAGLSSQLPRNPHRCALLGAFAVNVNWHAPPLGLEQRQNSNMGPRPYSKLGPKKRMWGGTYARPRAVNMSASVLHSTDAPSSTWAHTHRALFCLQVP